MEGERWVAEYGDVGWEIRPALGGSLIATAYSAGAARGIVLAHNACLGLADPERAIPAARAALEAEVRAVAHQHDGDGYCHPGCEEYRQLHTEARRLRNEALALLRGGSDGKAGA